MIEIIPNWHPISLHFTVAMLTVSIALFFVGIIFSKSKWHEQTLVVAHWNFWIGTIAAVATVIAGWLAYNTVAHDTPSHAAMTVHRNWAFITLGLLIPAALWLAWSKSRSIQLPIAFIASLAITLGLLGTTAWYGGELVYRYGLGVMSMPMMNEAQEGHDDKAHGHSSSAAPATSTSAKPKVSGGDGHNHTH